MKVTAKDAKRICREELEWELKGLQRSIDRSLEEIAKDPVYGLRWQSEPLVKNQTKKTILTGALQVFNSMLEEDASTDQIRTRFAEMIESLKKKVLEDPPTWNSTCAVTNMVNLWENEVKVEMTGGRFGGSPLSHIVRLMDPKRIEE